MGRVFLDQQIGQFSDFLQKMTHYKSKIAHFGEFLFRLNPAMAPVLECKTRRTLAKFWMTPGNR